jgi:hypothetical protein
MGDLCLAQQMGKIARRPDLIRKFAIRAAERLLRDVNSIRDMAADVVQGRHRTQVENLPLPTVDPGSGLFGGDQFNHPDLGRRGG